MPTLQNGKISYSAGEALPQVGSQAYIQAQQGIIPTGNPTTPIPASSIGGTTPLSIPPVQPTPASSTLPAVTNGAIGTTPAAPTYTSDDPIKQKLYELITEQGTEGQKMSDLNTQQGIDAKTQAVNDINNRINSTKKGYEDQINTIRQNAGGTFGGAVSENVGIVQRQADNHLADLAIEQAAANGNLKTAQDIVDAKIKAQFEPIDNQIKSLQSFYTLNQNDLSDSQQLALQEQISNREKARDFQYDVALLSQKAKIEALAAGANIDIANSIAYAQQYASTGQIPPGIPKGSFGTIAAVAKALPKPVGTLVDMNTGIASSNVTQTSKDGISALYDFQSKIDELNSIRDSGTFFNRVSYNALRGEMISLLRLARSGQAVTDKEQKDYESRIPGPNGLYPKTKLSGLKNSVTGTLNRKLSTNGLSIYGYSKVKLGDKDLTVGDVIDDGMGNNARVNPDGSLTPLN